MPIIIGRNSVALPVNFLPYDTRELIQIGNFSGLALGVKVFAGGEHYQNNVANYPLKTFYFFTGEIHKDGFSKGPTVIGNDVLVLYNATILSGVKIGDGAIVGACSVVAKDVPPYAIVAGNPAKIIKYRFSEEQIKALLRIRWWDWSDQEIKEFEEYFFAGVDIFIEKAFEKMEREGRL
jgi:virginiamycin A acetyltransferase